MVFAPVKRLEKTSKDLAHLPFSLTFPVSRMVDVATTSTRRGRFDACDGDESMSTVQTDCTQILQTVRTWPPELRQNLAGAILESLDADSPTPSVEWTQTMNARRCALIDKEIDGTLTAAERVELELLQKQAVAYRDRVAPVPIEGARELHQQLLARKRRNMELAAEDSRDQYVQLMGFPDDLPDLSRLRPPEGNSRPEGVQQSYFAQRQRGELPETY